MLMKRGGAILCLLAVFLLADMAPAAVFEYSLKSYPKEGLSCGEQAVQLGNRIAENTGLDMTSMLCQSEHQHGYDILLRYRADEQLEVTSTSKTGRGLIGAGAYETKSACLEDLNRQRQIFSTATGLSADVSYCLHLHDAYQSGTPWDTRIDGFGATEKPPFFTEVYLMSHPLGHTEESLQEMIRQGIENLGYPVSYVKVHGRLTHAVVGIRAYGAKRVRLDTINLGATESREACEAQLDSVAAAIEGTGGQTIGTFCGRDALGNVEAEMIAMIVRSWPYHIKKSPESYASMNECLAAKDEVLRYYRDELNRDIAGAACAYFQDEQRYRYSMMERDSKRP